MKERKPPKLAPNVHWKHGAYYFVKRVAGKLAWTRLGATEQEAFEALAELNQPSVKMLAVFQRYRREIIPKKAMETQKAQRRQLVNLERTFGHMLPPAIRPMNIAEFHDTLGKLSPVSANRHLSLMSHVCRFGMRIGAMDRNPCEGIQRHPEKPRTRYVTDQEYDTLYPFAGSALQLCMDMARLLGQREGNLIRLQMGALTDKGISFPAQKRGRPMTIEWSPEVAAVVERAKVARKALQDQQRVVCLNLIVNEDGQPMTRWALQSAVRRMWARYAAHVAEKKPDFVVERFTFHDLRAKAGSDSGNEKLLGHQNASTFRRIYQRKPEVVKPVK